MGCQFQFDEQKCTGCYACHIACLDAHYGPDEKGVSCRTIKKIIKQKEGFQKNVCPGCVHCGACIEVCPIHAIYREAKHGLVLVDREKCSGCKLCEHVCPVHVIHFDEEGNMSKCDGCGQRLKEGREPACVRACPVHAISYQREVLL